MPLGQGIADLLGAIPHRIEVAGHEPTWRITADSVDAALTFARECHGDPTALAVSRRDRWWARITVTVTTDPVLAAAAPSLDVLRAAAEPAPEPEVEPTEPQGAFTGHVDAVGPVQTGSPLEEIFAHQEQLRADRRRFPRQRGRSEK